MAAIANTLRHDLSQPEFSEGYAESFLDTYIATQLKVLREQNEWTQAQLAERMGKKQTVISRSENVNYSSWNINTLKEYARAFRLRLCVSFETYGSLIDEVTNFSKKNLERTPRESDPELADVPENTSADALLNAPEEPQPVNQPVKFDNLISITELSGWHGPEGKTEPEIPMPEIPTRKPPTGEDCRYLVATTSWERQEMNG